MDEERSVRDWLEQTTAAQATVHEVATVRPGDTLADAAALFLREKISGGPVVDEAGVCIGVLSVSDLLGATPLQDESVVPADSNYFRSLPALCARAHLERLVQAGEKSRPVAAQLVARLMTIDVVSVREETQLVDVLREMVALHVHRVVVLNADGDLVGVISTIDILSALLRTVGLFGSGMSMFGSEKSAGPVEP